eukprot:14798394-Alexandrium_andersonii.AAC.1
MHSLQRLLCIKRRYMSMSCIATYGFTRLRATQRKTTQQDTAVRGIPWHARMRHGTQWHCNGMQWHAMVCTGVLWNARACAGKQ